MSLISGSKSRAVLVAGALDFRAAIVVKGWGANGVRGRDGSLCRISRQARGLVEYTRKLLRSIAPIALRLRAFGKKDIVKLQPVPFRHVLLLHGISHFMTLRSQTANKGKILTC